MKSSFDYSILIAVFACALYANTLGHQFAFDDEAVLTSNEIVLKGWKGLPEIFGRGSWDGYDASRSIHIYRPLQLTVLAIQYEFFGLIPFYYHVVQVLSYALLCILVYQLLSRLIPTHSRVAFLAAILFTAHPVHTEVVANIKGNGDLLAMLFGVAALLALWKSQAEDRRFYALISAPLFLCALLFKETVVTVIGLAGLMLFFFSELHVRKICFSLIPWMLAVLVYLGMRSAVFDHSPNELVSTNAFSNVVMLADGWSQAIGTRLWALGKNLQLLLYPYPLVMMYVYNDIPMVEALDIHSVLAFTAYTSLAVVLWKNRQRGSVLGFAIGAYFVTIALFSNVFFSIPNIVSERWLLVPSMGICLAMACLFYELYSRWRTSARAVLIVLMAGFCTQTVVRNRAWYDNFTLASVDIRTVPNNLIVNTVLGNCLLAKSKEMGGDAALLAKAAEHYEKVLALNPSDHVRGNNLGLVYEQLGMHRKAAAAFEQVTLYDTELREKARYSLAKNYYLAGFYSASATHFLRLQKEHPDEIAVTLGLAASLERLGHAEEARQLYERALVNEDLCQVVAQARSLGLYGHVLENLTQEAEHRDAV